MKKFYWNFAKNPEPMTAWDWVLLLAYGFVTLAFLIFHTEVAIWVIVFVYLRDRVLEFDHKTLGNPNDRES